MKTSYQQYNSYLKCCAKLMGLSEIEAIKKLDRDISKSATGDDVFDLELMHMESCILMDEKNRPIHFFVKDESFLDWLVECVPSIEDGSPEAISTMTGERPAIIHFPTNSKYICGMFFVKKNWSEQVGVHAAGELTSIMVNFSKGNKKGYSGFRMSFVEDHARISLPESNVFCRLIAGLGMYLSCFPEMLKDGPPDDVKHPSHHQYAEIKTIGISPKVRIHSEHGEVTPHFRRGHFRVLRSEAFTHKRFQVVFIKQCFVKGDAATIVSPEESITA